MIQSGIHTADVSYCSRHCFRWICYVWWIDICVNRTFVGICICVWVGIQFRIFRNVICVYCCVASIQICGAIYIVAASWIIIYIIGFIMYIFINILFGWGEAQIHIAIWTKDIMHGIIFKCRGFFGFFQYCCESVPLSVFFLLDMVRRGREWGEGEGKPLLCGSSAMNPCLLQTSFRHHHSIPFI